MQAGRHTKFAGDTSARQMPPAPGAGHHDLPAITPDPIPRMRVHAEQAENLLKHDPSPPTSMTLPKGE
jgi:hypothetical protein